MAFWGISRGSVKDRGVLEIYIIRNFCASHIQVTLTPM